MSAVLRDSELLLGKAGGVTYRRENATESYVCIPPALVITDSNGATWTVGDKITYSSDRWSYYFNVLRNDVDTGIFAARVEYRAGKVRAWTLDGWRVWVERKRNHLSAAPGYWI